MIIGKTRCDLCGRRRFFVIHKKRGILPKKYLITDSSYGFHHQIVKCLSCGLVFAYPTDREVEILSRYSSFRDEAYEQERLQRNISQRKILDYVNKLCPKRGKLLEVGCATGGFLSQAKATGWRVLGVEPSTWASRIARKTHHLPVICGTLDKLKPGVKFDVVVCVDVLEHVVSPKKLLFQMKRVLKTGGLLCIVTPDYESLVAKILKEKWWHIRTDHIFYFSQKTLDLLTAKVGFSKKYTTSYGWTFSFDYWASRFANNWKYLYLLLEGLRKVPLINRLTKRSYSIDFRDSLEVFYYKE